MKIGIIGGGQLGWMLGEAAKNLGHTCVFVDPNPKCSAARIGEVLTFEYNDPSYVDALTATCDVVTYEFENVDVAILKAIAEKIPVYPDVKVLEISQDRKIEKEQLQEANMDTALWLPIDRLEDYDRAIAKLGFPFIVKTRRFGYDGKGQFAIDNEEDLARYKQDLPLENAIVEQMIPFDFEVSKIASRSTNGEIIYYPLTKNNHANGILRTSYAPLFYSTYDTLNNIAKKYCEDFMTAHNYVGTLAIEFFAIGDRLIANEFAPRVHNSGHWTMGCEITSQFENHIRAITGMPLGPTLPQCYIGMINVIGSHPGNPAAIREFPDTIYYDYGKEARTGRKLGHINTKADSYPQLVEKISQISTVLQMK